MAFLMIDNYDSFTYNLVRYFAELGEEMIVVKNNAVTLDDVVALDPTGIVLSPGPGTPDTAGICLDLISHIQGRIPLLGICLGHQAIAQAFGAAIVRGKAPVHGKVNAISHDGCGVFHNIKTPLSVTEYHSLIVERSTLPESLLITSETTDGVIMGIRHKSYPLEGVQFHPEAHLTECGHEILANFIHSCAER